MNEITIETIEELVNKREISKLRSICEEYNSVDLAE